MKSKNAIALLLCFIFITCGILTSCNNITDLESQSDHDSTASDTDHGGDEVVPDVEPVITGPYAETIMRANRLADKVQAYYGDPARSLYRIENQNIDLEYRISGENKVITSLTDKKGNPYLENTGDIFITMADGSTYYASQTTSSVYTNIYRMGYCYYDIHILGQNFLGSAEISREMDFSIKPSTVKSNQIKGLSVKDGVITYTADGGDPYVYTTQNRQTEGLFFPADEYNAVQFSVKASSSYGELYFLSGSDTGHNPERMVSFDIIADNEWHTYTVPVNLVNGYEGFITSLRFDIGNKGEKVQIKDVKAVNLSTDAPEILVDRTFHTYSDKMNQVIHFVASKKTEGIASMGFTYTVSGDTVEKLLIKDKNGTHDSLEGVDIASVEYVGFDIKNAGILGFILLPHENSGILNVSQNGGVYTVTQSAYPEGGILEADPGSTDDDFYMGHRLYTDGNHSFDEFVTEAENERNPLETVSGDTYLGYDALRGAYKFAIGGTGFNQPFFNEQNRHYSCDISVTGADADRNIYIYTKYDGGCGENAVILDKNDMLLPIPVMINKNFKGENEEPRFDPGDNSYSETYFPVAVEAKSETELSVLNLYMNWGKVPLKQLSSIQFFWPYYHLSLGTTETSCINPLYGAKDLWTLPDFRPLSMPYWFELPEGQGYDYQPQHTHAGYQYFLQYTDSEGNYSASENYHNDVISSGPVYTDVKMDYISDDGRIKVSYNHLELPETDELRAYYEIHYEVLEDITINDFAKDFSFYSFEGYQGEYRKMGYVDEGNNIVHKAVNASNDAEVLKLGDLFPYVSLYDLYTEAPSFINNNSNLGVIVADSEIIIDGKDCAAGFVAVGRNSKYSLSLDLERVTLKKGDTMTLCLIICPWGFYTAEDDINMQTIRQNTCIDPLTLTVHQGEAIESVYLPKVKSTNGESAEFTLSGGSNNKAVRVYGFNKLTVPKVYEKINGEWVEVVLNSSNTPDKLGYYNYYDGYAVYYDGDGTYSYAFAFNMDEAEGRTFRIVAAEDFEQWPKNESKVDICVELKPAVIQSSEGTGNGVSSIELSEDGSYARIFGEADAPEAFFQPYSDVGYTPSGQYLVIKYRFKENMTGHTSFEVFTSTEKTGAAAGDSFYIGNLNTDGLWHILFIDISLQRLPNYAASADGKYFTKYLRLDVFNSKITEGDYVDIAYVIMDDSIEGICDYHKNTETAEVYERGVRVGTIDFASGEIKK